MPELPEVEVTRLSFAPQITGAVIKRVQMGKPLRWPLGCDVSSLSGQTIHQVRRRGKYLLLDLDRGLLMIHLGMSGRLIYAQKLPGAGAHDHMDMSTNQGCLRLHDPRRFGAVVWAPSQQEGMGLKLLGHLGPEPLDEAFNVDQFIDALKKRTAPIKQVLLSGELVVGVGNIYASEVLFLAGIDPRKPACKISPRRGQALFESIRTVLSKAIAYGGSTLKDFQSTNGEHGLFQLQAQVYGRSEEECYRCGRPIKMIKQGQRSSFFCSHCQK